MTNTEQQLDEALNIIVELEGNADDEMKQRIEALFNNVKYADDIDDEIGIQDVKPISSNNDSDVTMTRIVATEFTIFTDDATIDIPVNTKVELISCELNENCITGVAVLVKFPNSWVDEIDASLLCNNESK